MDFLKELGSFTPRQLMARLVHLSQETGDLIENTGVVRTHVLTQGSARMSMSKYLYTGDVVVTVLYGDESTNHTLVMWKYPNGVLTMTLH